jgi:hypothetical protein
MATVKPKKGYLTITQVAKELGCQVPYVRTLIREHKIPDMLKRPLNSSQWRWEIPEAWVLEYKKTYGSRSKRSDGRNKYLIWMNPEESEKFTDLMAEHLPDVPWEVSYKRSTQPIEDVEDEEEDEPETEVV